MVGSALAAAMGLPAVAEDTSADESVVENLVFVGELVSIEPMENPCDAERRRTGKPGCIFLDALYRATYRVVEPVVGELPSREVTFQVADHYGHPPFAYFPNALLFVAVTDEGNWLHKYQGIPMHRTTDGQWAACGEVDRRDVDKRLLHRARWLTFAHPVASRDTFPAEGWEHLLPRGKEQRDAYRIARGQVHCVKGVPLKETYEVVRQGVMSARDVALPPWPVGR